VGTKVIALLDKPSSRSFGIVPLVVEDSSGLRILGFQTQLTSLGKDFNLDNLQQLIANNCALRVIDCFVDQELNDSTVALWLGNNFISQIKENCLELVPDIYFNSIKVEKGSFVVLPSKAAYNYIESWTKRAFKKYKQHSTIEEKRELASLMGWALPSNVLTLAAVLDSTQHYEKELDWQLRTDGAGWNREDWIAHLKEAYERNS
jgi:hypothetical protein